MQKAAKISDSELAVMQILWEAGEPLSVPDLRQKLESRWDSSTIKTLLRRLTSKGVLRVEKRAIAYYSPLISEREYREYAAQDLLRRVYRGSAKNLIASLVDGSSLTDEDLEELRALLEREGRHD